MDLHQNPAYHSTNLTYIGCFKNTFNDLDRMLFEGTYNNFRNNTPDWCVAYCTSGGYDYAGLQYGSQCICTNSGPQGTSDAAQCTYGCAGDNNIKMCGGLGYINIFHTDAHKTTIDNYGCGNTVQDTYYQKWYNDMGHCGVTPGGSGGSKAAGPAVPRDFILSVTIEQGSRKVLLQSLDPSKPVPSCLQSMPDFPQRDTGACASLGPDNIPVCCGGYWTGEEQKNCYRLDPTTRQWVKERSALVSTRATASIRHSKLGLMSFSGDAGHRQPQAINGSPSPTDGLNITLPLPDMPHTSYRHCAVELASGDIFVSLSFGRPPLLYNMTSGQWEEKSKPTQKRYRHACGVVKNINTGKEEVVVAGGSCEAAGPCPKGVDSDGASTFKTDIYDVETDTWRSGPNVPGPNQNFEGLAYDEHSFLIKLSTTKEFYKYDQASNGWLPTGVKTERDNTASFWVDSSIFPDCS